MMVTYYSIIALNFTEEEACEKRSLGDLYNHAGWLTSGAKSKRLVYIRYLSSAAFC